MSGRQHVPLLSRVISAALLSVLLGLLDFVLFELKGNLTVFREYVLYKPSLFGLSLLSFQLLSFCTLGILCFCFFSLGWLILGKPVGKRGSFPALPLFSAIFSLCMISLRVASFLRGVAADSHLPLSSRTLLTLSGADLRQAYSFVILIMGSAALVAYANVLHRSHVGATGAFATRLSLSPKSAFLVMSILMAASLFSPDVYSWYLRFPYHTVDQHVKAPNVLFIVLDTVRADHLSCYGYERRTTPNIDRISREALLFRNAFSAAPWTLPSHASMFTGLYPSQHQADWGHAHLDEGFPTLAEKLQHAGYQTVGFSENVFVGRTFGLARGFGEFHETWRRPLVVRAIARLATRILGYKERLEFAERSVGLLERWVSNHKHRGKPFFAFLNLMAAHPPRYPRPTFGSGKWTDEDLARIEPVNRLPFRYYLPKFRLTRQDLAIMVDLYDGEISYLDAQIGHVFCSLAAAGILDETIVILTSDHGENFGEHGMIDHQYCLYDTLLRVPLILRYPALLKPERIDKRVSTVFLFRTVMALLGTPGDAGRDRSRTDALGALQGQETIFAECSNGIDRLKELVGDEGAGLDFSRFDRDLKCVIEGDYKLIWASNGMHELYRIGEDPHEAENVIEKEQDRARALDQLLKSWELSTPRKLLF